MITMQHLDSVGVELAHIEELMAALEITSDGLQGGTERFERQAYCATMGVIAALQWRVEGARKALDTLQDIAREAKKAA